MGVTKSNKNNISSPKGNSLALFVDYNDGNLKLKDINGNVENFTAYAGVFPVGALQMEGGVPLDSTLRPVQDQNGNNSPLFLSTNSVTGRGTQGIQTDTIFGASSWRIRGGQNTVLGFQIGEIIVDSPVGSENTIVGSYAFGGSSQTQSETVGNKNVAIGGSAMGALLIPSNENIAIGIDAMAFGDFQSSIAIGINALTTNSGGLAYENVEAIAIGGFAIYNNDTLTIGSNIGIGGNSIQSAIINSTTLGYSAVPLSLDSNSVYLGYEANKSAGPTQWNVGIGIGSIRGTNVAARVGIGFDSGGYAVSIGGSNGLGAFGVGTAIGFQALQNATVNGVFAIGINALAPTLQTLPVPALSAIGLLGGTSNSIGIGRAFGTSSNNNTVMGKNVVVNPTGTTQRRNLSNCTYIGGNIVYPPVNSTAGHNSNTAIGDSSLRRVTTASGCTAIGGSALQNATTAVSTAIGFFALFGNSVGTNNTAIGHNAGAFLTTGTTTVILGASDGNTPDTSTSTQGSVLIGALINSGSNSNTLIGHNIVTTSGATNYGANIVLGKSANVIAASTFSVGSASVNAGTVNVESLTSDTTWTVRINGTQYKMLLKA